jgi:magnesium transporter
MNSKKMHKKTLNRKKINPSTPIFTGVKYSDNLNMKLFIYNENESIENSKFYEKDFNGFTNETNQYWLNTHAIHDLVIQDILDVNQRPKFQ